MKTCMLLAVLAFAASQVRAQTYEEATIERQLYFENAVFRLNGAQQAALDSLWRQLDGVAAYQIRIQGTADERGSAKINERLPRQRSEAVRDYLLQKGAKADKIAIEQGLILPVGIEQNNRRTDISITYTRRSDVQNSTTNNERKPTTGGVSFTNFAAFSQYNAQTATQQMQLKGNATTHLQGKKGVVLHIPKEAFVNAKGEVQTGDIRLNLREAHSYGDMILQNLATMSGDKLIETGGMIHLEAFNAAGEPLQLAKGKQIVASMPSKNASLEGMQTFVGAENPHAGVDWQATNTPVLGAGERVPVSPFLAEKGFLDVNSPALRDAVVDAETQKIFLDPLPQAVAMPQFVKSAPLRPNVVQPEAPELDDYYQKYENKGKPSPNTACALAKNTKPHSKPIKKNSKDRSAC